MKKIISIIGARPQFIKHAPMQLELQKYFNALTIHTGQHYDKNMSDVFFNELNIPSADFLLSIEGKTFQSAQTGVMMTQIEQICLKERPDALLIYGDTNSTLAAALVASKMHIKQIHIEAGLRSFNRQMPEEVNRIIADRFADLLFCPSIDAVANLEKEGINHDQIYVCGDVMCDSLHMVEDKLKPMTESKYYFVTLHRPYNTDDKERLTYVLTSLNKLDKKVIFPMHPRTVNRMEIFGLKRADFCNIEIIEPIGYVESLSYQKFASGIITDSGGMQKEAYMLKKKCVTIRSETEWTETLKESWNTLLFEDLSRLQEALLQPVGKYVEKMYGTGEASKEIVTIIRENI